MCYCGRINPAQRALMNKPWFGPRKFGFGWTPVTWQGWVVTVVLTFAVAGSIIVLS